MSFEYRRNKTNNDGIKTVMCKSPREDEELINSHLEKRIFIRDTVTGIGNLERDSQPSSGKKTSSSNIARGNNNLEQEEQLSAGRNTFSRNIISGNENQERDDPPSLRRTPSAGTSLVATTTCSGTTSHHQGGRPPVGTPLEATTT